MKVIANMENTKKWNFNFLSKYRALLMGVSTILVMFCHSQTLYIEKLFANVTIQNIIIMLRNYATVGVDMFLVLSAVGLYYSFKKDGRLGHFYKKRIVRILPEMLIVAILIYGLTPGQGVRNFLIKITALSVFTEYDRSIWFFAIILLMYLLFPLFYHLREKGGNKALVILSGLVIALNILIYYHLPEFYHNGEIVLTRIPIFIMGIVLADFAYRGIAVDKKLIGGGAIIIIVLLNIYYYLQCPFSLPYIDRYWNELLGVAYLIFFSLIFNKFKMPLIKKIVTIIGGYSLEVYLIYEYLLKHCREIFVYQDPYNLCYYLCIIVLTIICCMGLKKINNSITNVFLEVNDETKR